MPSIMLPDRDAAWETELDYSAVSEGRPLVNQPVFDCRSVEAAWRAAG